MWDDYVEPNWNDPVSLRACARRLPIRGVQMAAEVQIADVDAGHARSIF